MPDYKAFFLNAPASSVKLDTLAITHPNFSRAYYLVRNQSPGVILTLENGQGDQYFEFAPMRVRLPSSQDDLEQVLDIDLGDVGEIVAPEMDAVSQSAGFNIRPQVIYRAYDSSDTSGPIEGPWVLEIEEINEEEEGVSFRARAPQLNVNRTGDLYRIEDFPSLRSVT